MRLLRTAMLVALMLAPAAAAQQPPAAPAYAPTSLAAELGLPRTQDGRPDFQGVVWAVNFFPVFEGNQMTPTLHLPEAEAKTLVQMMAERALSSSPNSKIDPEIELLLGESDGLPVVRGQRRTRQVVLPADGRLPYRPEARKEANETNPQDGRGLDNHEERPAMERCLSLGGLPPMSSTLAYSRLQFVQTGGHVVIHAEQGDEARIIPFAAGPAPPGPAWLGRSTAHWEGDTLVIETTDMREEDRVRTVPKFIVGRTARVIERFTRLSKDELLYQWTVVDPDVYTAPWLAEFSFFATDTGMHPSPCHEHNYSLPNILQGRLMADERAAKP
jgi:hypothetical protein